MTAERATVRLTHRRSAARKSKNNKSKQKQKQKTHERTLTGGQNKAAKRKLLTMLPLKLVNNKYKKVFVNNRTCSKSSSYANSQTTTTIWSLVCFDASDFLTRICHLAIVNVYVLIIFCIGNTQISILLLCFLYLFVELMITMNE